MPHPVRFALGGTAGEGLAQEDLQVPSVQKQPVILCSPEQKDIRCLRVAWGNVRVFRACASHCFYTIDPLGLNEE